MFNTASNKAKMISASPTMTLLVGEMKKRIEIAAVKRKPTRAANIFGALSMVAPDNASLWLICEISKGTNIEVNAQQKNDGKNSCVDIDCYQYSNEERSDAYQCLIDPQ